jgi:microcystin-dependent protein
MSDQFIGEVRLMAFDYPPQSWAQCNGQLLPIQQNLALFSLLGTQYGGNGSTTFALPDLRGRVAVHAPSGKTLGGTGGEVSHTLTSSEIFPHSHAVSSTPTTPPNTNIDPTGSVVATAPSNFYAPFTTANAVAMDPNVILPAGSGSPHENRQPYLTVNFCIALQGIFPSKN